MARGCCRCSCFESMFHVFVQWSYAHKLWMDFDPILIAHNCQECNYLDWYWSFFSKLDSSSFGTGGYFDMKIMIL